jgi:hypothetical protein
MRFDLDHAIAVLERTPDVLDQWLRGLPLEWTTADEGPDTWNPFDIVGHLVDGEETDWIPRTQIILSDADERAFAPFDRLRHRTRNRGKRLDALLEEFVALRRRNLETLRGLRITESDLARTGVHPEFGAVTLEQHLATWVAHDLGHVAQIARVMAKQYSGAVGPWSAYLPVLHHGPHGS